MRNLDAAESPADSADEAEPPLPKIPALEPDTLPNPPLRAQDVPGFIPKLIG